MIASKKLLQTLRDRGISKIELAKRLGVLPQTIQHLLSEGSNPTEKTLHALVKALDISFGELYDAPLPVDIMLQIDGEPHPVKENVVMNIQKHANIQNVLKIEDMEFPLQKMVIPVIQSIKIDGIDYSVNKEIQIQISSQHKKDNPQL